MGEAKAGPESQRQAQACYGSPVLKCKTLLVGLSCVGFILFARSGLRGASQVSLTDQWDLVDATVVQTTHSGSIWAWWRSHGRIRILDANGTLTKSLRIPTDVSVVDVEPGWGVAFLDNLGKVLQVQRPDGERSTPVELPRAASGLAWVDVNRLAVAPDGAAHRVEIWDLSSRQEVLRMGVETPVDQSPGAEFLRRVHLAYSPQAERLYALESRTGDLEVFNLKGESVGAGQVENPRKGELDQWLREVDGQARAQGDSQRPSLEWFHLAVGPDGRAWTVQRCAGNEAQVVGFPLDGTPSQRVTVQTSCCSLGLAVLADRWLFYRSSNRLHGSCSEWVRRPSAARPSPERDPQEKGL